MKSIEEIADKYIREQYIDYGDLNDQAEIQIRDAVIFGLKQGQKLPIHNVVQQSELLPKRLSASAYTQAMSGNYEEFVEWWDSKSQVIVYNTQIKRVILIIKTKQR